MQPDGDRSTPGAGDDAATGVALGVDPDQSPQDVSPSWPTDLVTLYEKLWLPLNRVAFLLTGDRAVAEEVVQEAFVAARPRWDRIDNPGGYLRTSVVNATRDWGRRRAVADRHLARPDESTVDQPDELWDALARLDHRRRSAVVLRFYADLPDEEIAGILGCRPATVRTLIHRALRDLRRELHP